MDLLSNCILLLLPYITLISPPPPRVVESDRSSKAPDPVASLQYLYCYRYFILM